MAEKTIVNVEKVKHANIFEALAAFQGENPEIKKTKRFGKETDTMTFMYAELGDMISAISPFTSKHGLSYTWEEAGESKIRCVLYHETYEEIPTEYIKSDGENFKIVKTNTHKNRLQSAPITVARAGKMQTIGSDSTYARKYTLCEVLGIVSEEDKELPVAEESAKNAVKTVFSSFKDKIEKGTKEEVAERIVLIKKELAKLAAGKAPQLGLTAENYEQLGVVAEARLAALAVKEDLEHPEPAVNVE